MEKRKALVNLPIQFKNRRVQDRLRLTGLMPGRIKKLADESFISCRPVDISIGGIGILTSDILDVGELLVLDTPNQKVTLKVEWIKKDFGKFELIRYGLTLVGDEKVDLQELFKVGKCLVLA